MRSRFETTGYCNSKGTLLLDLNVEFDASQLQWPRDAVLGCALRKQHFLEKAAMSCGYMEAPTSPCLLAAAFPLGGVS